MKRLLYASLLTALFTTVVHAQPPPLWITGEAGTELHTVDTSTGSATFIGLTGHEGVVVLAFHPNGTLYTFTESITGDPAVPEQLAIFDQLTGEALIGQPLTAHQAEHGVRPGVGRDDDDAALAEVRPHHLDPFEHEVPGCIGEAEGAAQGADHRAQMRGDLLSADVPGNDAPGKRELPAGVASRGRRRLARSVQRVRLRRWAPVQVRPRRALTSSAKRRSREAARQPARRAR